MALKPGWSASSGIQEPLELATQAWTKGVKAVLLIRCAFPDDASEPISESEAGKLMAGVREFFLQNSYGQLRLSATVTPVFALPRAKASYTPDTSYAQLLTDAREAAQRAGFRMEDYDLDCVFTRPLTAGARGFGSIGHKGAVLHVNDTGLACHELGHNLGLWHANGWRPGDDSIIGPGDNIQYGDSFDVMGSGTLDRWHFNAFEKHFLDWLPAGKVHTVSSNGIYRLQPSDLSTLSDTGICALRLKKDLVREYWMETRRQFDQSLGWKNALLIHWSPGGASEYGTQLLDMNPRTATFTDAPLLGGQTFFDSVLGVKITTAPAEAHATSDLEVLVQSISQILIEAEAAEMISGIIAETAAYASQSRCLTSLDYQSAEARSRIENSTRGHFTAWARIQSPLQGQSSLAISVDGTDAASVQFHGPASPETWQWLQLRGSAKEPSLLAAVPIFLAAGQQTIGLRFEGTPFKLDCLVLTTDPTRNTQPLISPIPSRRAFSGETIGPIIFSVLDVETMSSELIVQAFSSDTNVIPVENIWLEGHQSERTLTFTPVLGSTGSATVTLSVTDPEQNQGTTRFNVTVIGPIQARLDAARSGDTVVLPPGIYYDQLTIHSDIILDGGRPGQVTIDAQSHGIPLTVTDSGQVRIRGVTFRNGRGSGVQNKGDLSLIDCAVLNNKAKAGLEGGAVLNYGTLSLEGCVIAANTAVRGAAVDNHGSLLMSRCTIRENRASQRGGGIYNRESGHFMLESSTVFANGTTDGDGGGIYNAGDIWVFNSTLSGNQAGRADIENDTGTGGAIFNTGTAIIDSCTVAQNQAPLAAGGIENRGRLALRNSILAENGSPAGTSSDFRGWLVSQGYNLLQNPSGSTITGVTAGNLLGVDPRLSGLGNYGGETLTHVLLPDSPAIDKGSSADLCTDQRGWPRPLDGLNRDDAADIGAVEFAPANGPPGIQSQDCRIALSPDRLRYTRLHLASRTTDLKRFYLTLVTRGNGKRYVLQRAIKPTHWVSISTNMPSAFLVEFDHIAVTDGPVQLYRALMLPD